MFNKLPARSVTIGVDVGVVVGLVPVPVPVPVAVAVVNGDDAVDISDAALMNIIDEDDDDDEDEDEEAGAKPELAPLPMDEI